MKILIALISQIRTNYLFSNYLLLNILLLGSWSPIPKEMQSGNCFQCYQQANLYFVLLSRTTQPAGKPANEYLSCLVAACQVAG